MIRTGILAAATLALSAGAVAQSVDFDDRFYVAPRAGIVGFDSDRGGSTGLFVGLGFGKYLTPNWALDLEATADEMRAPTGGPRWGHYGLGLSSRHFFGDVDASWRPYGLIGVGALKSDRRSSARSTNPAFTVGIGFEKAASARVRGRAELAYRFDIDDQALGGENDYGDIMLNVGFTVALGPDPVRAAPPAPAPERAPAPAPTPAPVAPPEEPPCPPARPGQIIGPDGCPVDVTIDLRGVNFEFDSAQLRPDAVSTLNEAVDILKRFNTIQVEVAGHTCSIGSETYNQSLSERRAKSVYDYLVQNGIEAGRLRSAGYGESRPLRDNSTAAGREANRRTELVIDN